jgi:hypothetical protein
MNTKNPWLTRYIAVLFGVSFFGVAPTLFNFVVDPFNMNGWFDLDLNKREISVKAHYPLFKMIEYPRNRGSHIILGDSRSRALQDKYFKEAGFSGAYNFAYGGATIPELYSTYEYLRENTKLKTLIIGVPLRTFDLNHRNGLNRVPEAIEIAGAPFRYYSSWFVAKTGWANIDDRYGSELDALARFMPSFIGTARAEGPSNVTLDSLLDPALCEGCRLPEISNPAKLPMALRRYGLGLGVWSSTWQEKNIDRVLPKKFARQVSKNAANDWRKFTFSEELWSKVAEIAEWCDRDGIRLFFFVPPTILEMQHRIADFGLADVNHAYRARLTQYAPVIDFDFDNALTRELSHFNDAYHFDSGVAREIAAEFSRLIMSTHQRKKTKGRKGDLIRCPIEKEDSKLDRTHDQLSLRVGVNCRIWSRSDV